MPSSAASRNTSVGKWWCSSHSNAYGASALFGERGRRLGDHAFVVVQTEDSPFYFIVGMTNSAPWLPAGQRCVTVLTLV